MKRYDGYDTFDKQIARQLKNEEKAGGFRCSHCKTWVVINAFIGTANRNHCNGCLWSKHVDIKKGDRLATCHGGMRPIGLTFKQEGRGRIGEIMLVHLCLACSKLSINRIAGDDIEQEIIAVFEASCNLDDQLRLRCESAGIELLTAQDSEEVRTQLFGKMS